MTRVVELRRGAYHDSVTLLQLSRTLADRDDVEAALVAMATELNLDLLAGMGFSPPADATPNDLVIAIEATDEGAVDAAVRAFEEGLRSRPSGSVPDGGSAVAPPTITAAARRAPATLALVSTPGRVAVLDAADAVTAGLDVMVFSDNVTVADEIALKDLAAASDRLVMGPDCGTAVVDGVGLGFANVVRPGRVALVAASGTGAQHLMCLLDGAGVGVKHCLGVGGRDLSAAVQGRSTRAALDRLAVDDDVELVVLVSKPPDESVATEVLDHARGLGKPVVEGYLGAGRLDLTQTAQRVVEAAGGRWREPLRWAPARPRSAAPGYLRGLFTGGTLCDEAMLVVAEALGPVASNIPLAGHPEVADDLAAAGHTFLDFGDDALTAGRPHPMIDPSLRLERLRRELADETCAVVLLDVVLGHGSHPDPAAELAPVVAESAKPVVVALIGSRDDAQGLEATAERLADAGAVVHASNAAAAREALSLLTGEAP